MEIKFFKAWFLFFIVATIGGSLVGAVFGAIIGYTLGTLGYEIGTIKITARVLGFCVGMPISYFCFKWSVGTYMLPQLKRARGQDGS